MKVYVAKTVDVGLIGVFITQEAAKEAMWQSGEYNDDKKGLRNFYIERGSYKTKEDAFKAFDSAFSSLESYEINNLDVVQTKRVFVVQNEESWLVGVFLTKEEALKGVRDYEEEVRLRVIQEINMEKFHNSKYPEYAYYIDESDDSYKPENISITECNIQYI